MINRRQALSAVAVVPAAALPACMPKMPGMQIGADVQYLIEKKKWFDLICTYALKLGGINDGWEVAFGAWDAVFYELWEGIEFVDDHNKVVDPATAPAIDTTKAVMRLFAERYQITDADVAGLVAWEKKYFG